jgi:glutamyl-tRNA synthetase
LVEQRIPNPQVGGSIPSGRALYGHGLFLFSRYKVSRDADMSEKSITATILDESIVRLLFPDWADLPSLDELEKRYPERGLRSDSLVTRFAPSPTGFVHLGAISTSLINRQLAHQSGGVFLLRIEDTDSKRRIDGAFETIVQALTSFNLAPDEGFILNDKGEVIETGSYGPYAQSERLSIHRAGCLALVREGNAYPCFASEEELKNNQEIQKLERVKTGYYGRWAPWRDASPDMVMVELTKGTPFIIRFRAPECEEERISWHDGIHGKLVVPRNDIDSVILKSDGSSLYHLAHAVDDHFMRVTDVIRADEWVASVPLHLQLFDAFGWTRPRYTHLAPIQKLEHVDESGITRESRRKLSKRKDPEANIFYYYEQGVPRDALLEYLLNIADSAFEEWREKNPLVTWEDFPISATEFSRSGALVDLEKMKSVSKEYVGRLTLEQLYAQGLAWSEEFDQELAQLMRRHQDYTKHCLNIEREEGRASKRIVFWTDLRAQLWWFYDELYDVARAFDFPEQIKAEDRSQFLKAYFDVFNFSDSKEEWFERCKAVAGANGYAVVMKDFKRDPSAYKGSIADATMLIRVALSSQRATPDLYQSMQVLGKDRVIKRLKKFV